ncbi:MAG: ABC transporter ATP-binding protein [Anaerostipes sp.]|nr:ABC transporter ATP-binding protein [Anaerostipes sp.]MDD3745310.1 ABC transporter ATP-binding protein [Anaerostipes sp.]
MKNTKRIIKGLIWSIKRIVSFKASYFVLLILEAILNGINPIISLLLTQRIINDIQLKSESLKIIMILIIALSIYEILNELLLNFVQLRLKTNEIKFETFMQIKILKKISKLDSKEFESSDVYDLINRTQYDANTGILGNLETFFNVISNLIGTVSYIVILMKYNILFLLTIIAVPIVRYYFEKKYSLLEYDTIIENTELERRSSYISYVLTNAESFKEIKVFNLFSHFIKQYEEIKGVTNSKLENIYNRKTLLYSILSMVETVIDFLITATIVFQTFIGKLLIGQFILYNNSISSLKQNMISIFKQLSTIYKNVAVIIQVKNFFELPLENVNSNGIIIDKILNIKLEDVSYKYKNQQDYTLKNINISFDPSDFVILMGYNGSGKSTLMKILMCVYHDYEGMIYVNGIDLKLLNKEAYREKVGVMFQNYIKYETKISENILYGNLEEKGSSRIDELLVKVGLNEFKEKKNQILGYQFSEGQQISIGQWQKLATARALISDAELYIFDEPNSSLDLMSEKKVLNSIISETDGKIKILIMHRFSELMLKANKIIVLDKGRINEIGTHDDLLKNKGIYYKLYSLQDNI